MTIRQLFLARKLSAKLNYWFAKPEKCARGALNAGFVILNHTDFAIFSFFTIKKFFSLRFLHF